LDDRQAWRMRVFAATWLSYAGYYFARKPFSIVKGEMDDVLHLGPVALGNIGAAYYVAYAIGQFASGGLGSQFGPRVVLLIGMALSVVCNGALGFTDSPSTMMVFMALNGFAQSTGWSANVGTMVAWFAPSERGRVMGLWATNFQVGGVLANGLAAYVGHAAGYKYAFVTGSAILLVVWGINVLWQRNRPEDVGLAPIDDPLRPGETAPAADAPAPPGMVTNLLLVATFYFFVKFIRYAIWSWASYFLKNNFGLATDVAGYYGTLFEVFGIPGVIATGWLSQRYFANKRASVSLVMLTLLMASCLGMFALGNGSLPIFIVCLCVAGFALYGPDALMTGAGAMDIGSKRHAALAAGVISGFGSMGSVVQEVVIPRLYSSDKTDLSAVFGTLLAAAAGAFVMMGIIVTRNKLGKSDV
jgi:sugar phosphate permease